MFKAGIGAAWSVFLAHSYIAAWSYNHVVREISGQIEASKFIHFYEKEYKNARKNRKTNKKMMVKNNIFFVIVCLQK